MRSARSFFFTLAGLTFVGVVALFTASIGLLLTGILSVMLVGEALASYFSPQPARARKPGKDRHVSREMRVWNDGKGTIIDM